MNEGTDGGVAVAAVAVNEGDDAAAAAVAVNEGVMMVPLPQLL